ncbi:hypothetical protein [Legionella gresilensis]|uniref:hypothetical protein n=1 Tax=Legionella gresilensis TaxID=91823 RepID=UPI0010412F82|nr:hypothetical protein [Legionella gresilensis]
MKKIDCFLNSPLEELAASDPVRYTHLLSLIKLNELITNYNKNSGNNNNSVSECDPSEELNLLKQIESQVSVISENYKKNPVFDDENYRRFFTWRAQIKIP